MSDAELIAILINTGTKEDSAVAIAKKILAYTGNNLIELSKLSINDFSKFKGIGKKKAITIITAIELGRRRREAEVIEQKKLFQAMMLLNIFILL